jgi:uncharacterized protein YuzE
VTLSYDQDADVLYVTFERLPHQEYIYVENENGDILRLDKCMKRVVGCTIPFFSKRSMEQKISVPEVGEVPFNERTEELLTA